MQLFEDNSEAEVPVSLRNQQKELRSQIIWYRSLLAPIRKLPLECLIQIFALVCMGCKVSRKEVDCPATRLSQVCAGWGELARSIPIWSHININLYWVSSFRCNGDVIRSILTTHLELSKNSPLCIVLGLPADPTESQTTSDIIHLLFPHSRRFQDFSFQGSSRTLWSDGFASIKGNLPQLQSLSLGLETLANSSPSSRKLDIFYDAPQLRVVRYTHSPDYAIEFPWTQITDFTSQYTRCSLALEDLSRLTMADKVTLHCCDTRQTLPNINTPTNMPFRSLSIDVDDFGYLLSQWFRWFTLPNLEVLQLSGVEFQENHPNGRFTIEDLPSFISRSSCTIRSLSFSRLAVSDKDIITLLRSLPMFSELTIHERHYGDYGKNVAVTDTFLKCLTVDHENYDIKQPFLSRLSALNLRVHAPFATEKLVHMIQSCWIPDQKHSDRLGVVSLLSFNLMVLYEREAVDIPITGLQMLDSLKADGLEYNLTVEALAGRQTIDVQVLNLTERHR
ncbi:hypothetical protein K435DRAFT_970496 [Dendrothele bispora CBS 962.96]|uniref:F-box domain-containing protein n=1 Tax=Dendrothele bispora (strain CBS 962.96) TaxID=1314807 RepID=A0A4S8LBB8_DENBC|nr:hypothetical protein K435DRAFT_970496 [Dendrothele bispora CBS 962.96]